jgi:hypothetical protein
VQVAKGLLLKGEQSYNVDAVPAAVAARVTKFAAKEVTHLLTEEFGGDTLIHEPVQEVWESMAGESNFSSLGVSDVGK